MSEKLKIKINIIFVLVVLFNFNAVNFLKAEDNNFLTKDTLPLTLMQCIELTLTNNPEIIVSKINVAIQEQQIIKRDAEFMPSFQLGVYNSENNQVSITEVQSKSESAYSTAKLNTKIKTGADIALSHTLKKNEASSAAVNPSYSNDLSFSFNQPLLKNFGVKSTTAFLKIEKNNKLISRENLRKKVIDILSELQKNYWDLIYAIETYNVQRQSLEISEKLYRDNIKRVELGALAQIEITRAAAGAAEQTEKIIASENNIYSQRDLLLSKMNLINNSNFSKK